MIDQYPYKKICEGIYEISEFGAVSMYLVEGEDKALLIDTGVGVGNLKSFVQKLTNKPVEVFITHNHRDHISNAALFDHIYISEMDSHIGPLIYPVSIRLQFAAARCSLPEQVKCLEQEMTVFTEADVPAVTAMKDGDSIDLGGRRLTGFLCPGHSPGSMVLLDDKTGFMFCGDVCNHNLGLGVRNIPNVIHASMEDTLRAMQRIRAMDFDHRHIFNGHADPRLRPLGTPVPEEVYTKLMELMELIIGGGCEIEKRYIATIHTHVEHAALYDVSIDFHSQQVHGRNTARLLTSGPIPCCY